MSPMLFPEGLCLSFIAQFVAVLYGVKLAQHWFFGGFPRNGYRLRV